MKAYTRFNDADGKFELMIDNKVFRKTAGGEVYLIAGIENYKNFSELGIDMIQMMNGTQYKLGGTCTVQESDNNETNHEKLVFDVNKRFDFMSKFVRMTATKQTESTILVGQGGLGKTHTVISTLESLGMSEENGDYVVVKGYSTAKGLYRTLYENRKALIIFDDTDSIFKDATAQNILKGALDSYSVRKITWNAEMSQNDDLPKTFTFRGNVIFISNLKIAKFPQALISRSYVVDLEMTKSEIIDRMEYVLDDVMPNICDKIKKKSLDFIKSNVDYVGDLNFRTLQKVIKICDTFKDDFEDMALYTISN